MRTLTPITHRLPIALTVLADLAIPGGMSRRGSVQKLAKAIIDWPPIVAGIAATIAVWLWIVGKSARTIEEDGWPEVERLLDQHGAVIVVLWHQRVMLAPRLFPTHQPVRPLVAATRAGRLVSATSTHFGITGIAMKPGQDERKTLREVLNGLANGRSTALAVDGSSGPPRIAKPYPIMWARSSGVPIVLFAAASKRSWIWPTWDRMICPRLFSRISLIWQPWDVAVGPRVSSADIEALAARLSQDLDVLTAEADRRVGHPGPIL